MLKFKYQMSLSGLLKEEIMVKKCVYCKSQIDDSSVIDVCVRCGISVWGEKMFATIVENMESAEQSGNLYQGSISKDPNLEKP